MEYIIVKNENQYVKYDHKNKITHTSNITLAERFGYKEAKSLINNQIKCKDRSLYSIIEDIESEPTSLRGENTIFEKIVCAHLPINWFKPPSPPKKVSEEQRKAASERFKAMWNT